MIHYSTECRGELYLEGSQASIVCPLYDNKVQMKEWIWGNGGMILTGETWSTGRETLYSVGGRWMNGYGALVEWYWQGKTEVLGEKPVPRPLYPPQISHGLTKPGPSWQEAVGETPKPWHCFSGSPFTFSHCMHSVVEDGTGLYFWYAVGWGTALQAGSSRVRFPLVSLEFFIVLIVPAALWSWYRLNL